MRSPRALFWACFIAALGLAAWPLLSPAPPTVFPVAAFSRLPVLEGGRIKPIDSFARNSLLLIRGTQSLPVAGRYESATEWLMEMLFKPEDADTRAVFVIDDPDVLGLLGLRQGNERRFTYRQIEPKRDEVIAQAQRADKVQSAARSRFQNDVIALARRLDLYEQIQNTVMIAGSDDPMLELSAFGAALPGAVRAAHSPKAASARDKDDMRALADLLERYRFLAAASAFRPLAPREDESADAWLSYGEAMIKPPESGGPHPGLAAYAMMARSYRRSDPSSFLSAMTGYSVWLDSLHPAEVQRAKDEVLFNTAQPFISGMVLYVAALLALFAWWATRRPELSAAAKGIYGAAVLVHTVGLIARIWLQGRPPVTNLYSSAVFVGWVAALLGLFAERMHKKGFALAGGAALGFCTLLIAQHLGASGDTMEMMRAVLDSNFWLGTHVVTVTIGYGSTFLAGALGVTWVLRRQFVRDPDPEMTRALVSLAYGVVAFALLFSFIGTMLGGIWADQSWGRFWGWDPKENGALLIVLWNAFILHARFAGYARERGVMVMTVFGNIVTSLSWFGVNMLGIGLHSYGFMDQAFYWLLAFGISQLLLIVLGLLPPRFWEQPPVPVKEIS